MYIFRLLVRLVLRNMKNATDDDIFNILKAAMEWQNQRFPDYEMVILSLPKFKQEEREMLLACMVNVLREYRYIGTKH